MSHLLTSPEGPDPCLVRELARKAGISAIEVRERLARARLIAKPGLKRVPRHLLAEAEAILGLREPAVTTPGEPQASPDLMAAETPTIGGENSLRTINRRGLLGVGEVQRRGLLLSDSMAWLKNGIGRFVAGGVYLIAGQPGIGKSTLGIQVALDLGRQGLKTLYVLTEQSKEELAARARLMCSDWPTRDAEKALANIQPEDTLAGTEDLPSLLTDHVTSKSGKYNDISLVVVDSIQGRGLASSSTRSYARVYDFIRQCKAAEISTFLVAHVTKSGDIAGPKALEHIVDCVLVMKRAMIYRPLFVPKNRFGPAVLTPLPLQMDKRTTSLRLSPHTDSVGREARTYLGQEGGFATAQAAVALPRYGTRGTITASGLPQKGIEQLLACIGKLPGLEIQGLDYVIQCQVPGQKGYREILGLSLCMALISAYLEKHIPENHVYLGGVDLLGKVRDVPKKVVLDLAQVLGNLPKQGGDIGMSCFFCSQESAKLLRMYVSHVDVKSCDELGDAVFGTWPDLRTEV